MGYSTLSYLRFPREPPSRGVPTAGRPFESLPPEAGRRAKGTSWPRPGYITWEAGRKAAHSAGSRSPPLRRKKRAAPGDLDDSPSGWSRRRSFGLLRWRRRKGPEQQREAHLPARRTAAPPPAGRRSGCWAAAAFLRRRAPTT